MASTKTFQPSTASISSRSPIADLGLPQPAFVLNLKNRFKNPSIANAAVVSSLPMDSSHVGDVQAQDIFAGAIKDVHIHSLTADKISAGTINTGEITIVSEDGAITITGSIMSIDNGSGIRQVTFGNYTGSRYGLAFGSDPDNPDMELTGSIMSINTVGFIDFKSGSDATFRNSGNTVTSLIGYIINQFVIQGDSTNGLNLFGNGGNICLGETAGSYGGGVKVVFIPNASAEPTTPPVAGGILWVYAGALKFMGSSGTITTLGIA